jgi:hypothetical protein
MTEYPIPKVRSVVTRDEAIALGLKRYYPGAPCAQGHLSEYTVINYTCVECKRAGDRRNRVNNLERLRSENRAYHEANRESILIRRRQSYDKNREKMLDACRAWRSANLEWKRAYDKAYVASHIKQQRQHQRNWVERNKDQAREIMKAARRKILDTAIGALNNRMSKSIRRGLVGGKCGSSWRNMVEYTPDQLKSHIERQFVRGMGWHNRHKWHIDHIIPLASFTFSTPDDPEFKAAWALANLRPLWKAMNLSKNAKRLFLL